MFGVLPISRGAKLCYEIEMNYLKQISEIFFCGEVLILRAQNKGNLFKEHSCKTVLGNYNKSKSIHLRTDVP